MALANSIEPKATVVSEIISTLCFQYNTFWFSNVSSDKFTEFYLKLQMELRLRSLGVNWTICNYKKLRTNLKLFGEVCNLTELRKCVAKIMNLRLRDLSCRPSMQKMKFSNLTSHGYRIYLYYPYWWMEKCEPPHPIIMCWQLDIKWFRYSKKIVRPTLHWQF